MSRHFVSIPGGVWGSRQVHYRRIGNGPSVVLLHQAPVSSREMSALAERWAPHFTCIAVDHPGFGLSTPANCDEFSMREFAEALVETLDALAVEQTALYGFHTGACLAVATAALQPERIWACVANGLVLFDDLERADLLSNYLPELRLADDGSHLTWIWQRLRDKFVFFPWHRTEWDSRLQIDLPDADTLQDLTNEMLRSNDQYRAGYRSAFVYDANDDLRDMETPTLAIAPVPDATAKHLERISQASSMVQCELVDTYALAEDRALSFLTEHSLSRPPAPTPTITRSLSNQLTANIVELECGEIRVLLNAEASGTPVLLIHDAIGSADTVRKIAESFIGIRPVIAVDLPGHGESPAASALDGYSIAAQCRALQQLLEQVGDTTVDCVGIGTGGNIAVELARRTDMTVTAIAIVDPDFPSDADRQFLRSAGIPDWRPKTHGGHLLAIWHCVRDRRLFRPWYKASADAALLGGPRLDNRELLHEATAFMQAPLTTQSAILAHGEYRLDSRLRQPSCPVILCSWSGSGIESRVEGRASMLPTVRHEELGCDPADLGHVLTRLLEAHRH